MNTQTIKKSAALAKPEQSLSSPDKVADAINEGILRGQYIVGQRLVESDMVHHLKVSRGTVREALKKLSASGIVTTIPHRGAFIRSLSRDEAYGILPVLEVLCGLAARLAAANISKGGNRKLFETATKALLAYQSNVEQSGFLEERAHFYSAMFKMADNSELDRVTPLPRIFLFRSQFHRFLSKSHIRDMLKEYQLISAAILAGDESAAETRMRRHIKKTADRIDELPDSAFFEEREAD